MNPVKRKLILFDIDGTLITAGGAGTRSLDRAFNKLFGIKDAFKTITMSGKTDIQIIKEGLRMHALPEQGGNVEKMQTMYISFLQKEIKNPWKRIQPGITDLLCLLQYTEMTLGLLTGNIEEGARIKLSAFDLNQYFIDGAFGSDHEDRDELLPIAIDKFTRKGFCYKTGDCIVVGDTPRDVRCAKIHGAQCIAVATGPYSKEELKRTDADMVFDSFEDAEECAAILQTFSR